MRDEKSGLDKRKNQNRIYIFMAVLATDERWPEDWYLGTYGFNRKRGKLERKKQGPSSPTHTLNACLWLLGHGYPSSTGEDVGLGKNIDLYFVLCVFCLGTPHVTRLS